ncbi:MAG TPA: hypothetical protein VF242_08100 [Nitrososphaeraceae archaeon]
MRCLHIHTYLLQVRGLFRPVPYLAFPLYHNNDSGNGTETRFTIYAAEGNNHGISSYKIVIRTEKDKKSHSPPDDDEGNNNKTRNEF